MLEYRLKGSDDDWMIWSDLVKTDRKLYEYRNYEPLPPPPMNLKGSRGEAAARGQAAIEALRRRDQAALERDVANITETYNPTAYTGWKLVAATAAGVLAPWALFFLIWGLIRWF